MTGISRAARPESKNSRIPAPQTLNIPTPVPSLSCSIAAAAVAPRDSCPRSSSLGFGLRLVSWIEWSRWVGRSPQNENTASCPKACSQKAKTQAHPIPSAAPFHGPAAAREHATQDAPPVVEFGHGTVMSGLSLESVAVHKP